MTTIDETNVAKVEETKATNETKVNETSKADAQSSAVNDKKEAAKEVVKMMFDNLPGWVKGILKSPIALGVMATIATRNPIAGLGTMFAAGTASPLMKQFEKMADASNGKSVYKDGTVSDKDINLAKDGTVAYTGAGTVKSSQPKYLEYPGLCEGCFGPGKSSGAFENGNMGNKGVQLDDGKPPMRREPQAPPTIDEKKETPKTEPKKEEPKKETPKKEEPKKEEPKKEEPKAEPKKEEPKAEPKPEVVAEKTVTIPQPMGDVQPKVPETQPTADIPTPINNGPASNAEPTNGDVIVTKPRVIHVGESEKETNEKEVTEKDTQSKEDSDVGIWENRDDIDKNDTKDNSGGDYSSNSDNRSVSSSYNDLLASFEEPASTPSTSDGPDF